MIENFNSVKKLLADINLLTRSENTKKTYIKGLIAFSKIFEIDNLDEFVEKVKNDPLLPAQYYKDFLINLSQRNVAPKTIATWSAALKKFFLVNDVKIDKNIKLRIFKVTEDYLPKKEELKFLINNVDLRTKVILLILLSSGLRIDELRNLKIKDVDLDSNPVKIYVRGTYAKERKARITFISSQAKEELLKYLSERKSYNENDYLIVTRDNKQLSYSNIQYIVNKAFKIISEKEGKRYKLHSHSLRKFFKTTLLNAGMPVQIVDKLMGHQRYLAAEYELYTEEQLKEWYLKYENYLIL